MESVSRLALQANEGHKNALDAYTNKLQTELQAVEKLIAAVEQLPEDETLEDPGDKWCLHVENAFKPTGVIDITQTRHMASPFYEESGRRDRYMKATVPNPFSNSEKRYLEKAIVKENKRLAALSAKRSGQDAFAAVAGGSDFFMNNINSIDWASIARDVSASNSPLGSRTAQECKVRWLGAQHPSINAGKWTDQEEERLRELVESKRHSQIDWEDICRLLGTNRTTLDCIRRYQAGSRPPLHWTKALDKKLMDAVRDHGNSNWTLVATLVSPEVSANQCQIRYKRTLDPDIKRGKFSAEEDQLLEQAVKAYGSDWMKVAQAIPGRTNAQCRERYMHQLTAEPVKAPWTDEEDTRLMTAAKKLGNQWEKVREEMGCVRQRIQYANRYRILARREAREAAAQTAGGVCAPISQGGQSSELESAVLIDPERSNQDNIGSTSKAASATQKTGALNEKGAKRGRKQKLINMPAHPVDFASQGEGPNNSIPEKRPRPKPRFRGPIATTHKDAAVNDAASSTTALGPESTGNNAQELSQVDLVPKDAEQLVASSDRTGQSQQMVENVAISLSAELSDLTDLEDLDLEDTPRPKKKLRPNMETANIATPQRTPRTRKPKGETASTQESRTAPPSHTMTTRSSKNNVAQCQ